LTYTFGSLFAGIGGFDLGLERVGMVPRWQVENNPFSQHILNKHWPDVPCYGDIRDVRGEEVEPVDIICGGFPCQDISNAGRRAGIEGARSSLWKEYARLVGELRPRYVIVENVAALRRRGLDVVLGDLAALGYDAEWDGLRASDFGAPHRRDRIWIVAYPDNAGCAEQRRTGTVPATIAAAERSDRRVPNALGKPLRVESGRRSGTDGQGPSQPGRDGHQGSLADAQGVGQREPADLANSLAAGWDPRRVFGRGGERARSEAAAAWAVEPDGGRVAHGVPARVDRLTGLGNALVPQIAEWIGRRILDYEGLGPCENSDEGLNGR
jgi:DNA (cytosine-5)-methyltransferase 1